MSHLKRALVIAHRRNQVLGDVAEKLEEIRVMYEGAVPDEIAEFIAFRVFARLTGRRHKLQPLSDVERRERRLGGSRNRGKQVSKAARKRRRLVFKALQHVLNRVPDRAWAAHPKPAQLYREVRKELRNTISVGVIRNALVDFIRDYLQIIEDRRKGASGAVRETRLRTSLKS